MTPSTLKTWLSETEIEGRWFHICLQEMCANSLRVSFPFGQERVGVLQTFPELVDVDCCLVVAFEAPKKVVGIEAVAEIELCGFTVAFEMFA